MATYEQTPYEAIPQLHLLQAALSVVLDLNSNTEVAKSIHTIERDASFNTTDRSKYRVCPSVCVCTYACMHSY